MYSVTQTTEARNDEEAFFGTDFAGPGGDFTLRGTNSRESTDFAFRGAGWPGEFARRRLHGRGAGRRQTRGFYGDDHRGERCPGPVQLSSDETGAGPLHSPHPSGRI